MINLKRFLPTCRKQCKSVFRILFCRAEIVPGEKSLPKARLNYISTSSQPLLKEISDILLSYKDSEKGLLDCLIGRFLLFVFDLPASEEHHDSERGGLFLHSLSTVVESLRKFRTKSWQVFTPDGVRDRAKSIQMRTRWQYAVIIAALLHDVGKVFDVEVVADRQDKKEIWQPNAEGLYSFARRCKFYEVKWKPDRVHNRHNLFSNYLLHYIVYPEDVAFLGSDIFPHLLDALTLHPGNNRLTPIIGEADKESTSKAPVGGKEFRLRKDTVENFCDTVRHFYKDNFRAWQPNLFGGRLFIGTEYTAIVSPIGINEVIEEIKNQGNPNVPALYRVQDMLRAKGVLKEQPDKKNVYRMKFTPQGEQTLPLSVIFVKNDFLWGDEIPPVFTGKCEFVKGESFEFVKNG